MAPKATKPLQEKTGEEAEREIKVNIAPNKLTASVRLQRPEEGRTPPVADDLRQALRDKNVTFGIDDEAIDEIIANSLYDKTVVVARGKEPEPGNDARLIFKFDKVQELKPREDEDGRIDYRDIDFIQSATAEQVLVEKVPPTEGVPGTDVFGESVSAKSGRDIKLSGGSGTKVSEDGMQLLAAIDGAIVYASRMVRINSVHVIGGDVCIETGNIHHNGSLIIRGKVDSNFQVTAKGDIEIAKNAADARIISGGNIMVKGGFLGNHRGLLKAEGDVHVKYVNDQSIVAGNEVRIGGEAFNAHIAAKRLVAVSGSRGRIVGGKIMAGDEIKATILGSEAGTRTEIQVAYDARLMKQYYDVMNELKLLDDNAERVKEGLYTFYRLDMDNQLTPDKRKALVKLEEFNRNLPKARQELEDKKSAIEAEIQKNKDARIIAVKKVYPGVILQFGVIYKEIDDTMGPTIFTLQGNTVTREKYKPARDDM